MKKSARIALGTVLLFAVLAAGFVSGYRYLQYRTQQQVVANAIAENHTHTRNHSSNVFENRGAEKPPATQTLYYFTPPSVGILLHKKEIDIPKGTLFPLLVLPPDQAKQYPKGGRIIFYDNKNKLLDIIGEITDSFPAKESGKTAVLISLRTLDTTLANKFSKAYLATDIEKDVARLPAAAIVKGEGGGNYVWELEDESRGVATAFLKGITVKSRHEGYVVIEPGTYSSNDYITNPDDALEDAGRVRVKRKYFEGPAIAESDLIAKKIDDGFEERQKTYRLEQQAVAAAGKAKSCGAAPSLAQDFIQKARKIAKEAAAP